MDTKTILQLHVVVIGYKLLHTYVIIINGNKIENHIHNQ